VSEWVDGTTIGGLAAPTAGAAPRIP